MNYAEVPKRTNNAIRARMKQAVSKYGFDEVRIVSAHFFNEIKERLKLQTEIKDKERELQEMKKKNKR